ncbi:alpha/beta fold hydrolase [Chloroflexota bacterium]
MPVASGLYYFAHNSENIENHPMVLVHGAGQNHLSWPPGIRRLPGECVLAVELPGHGKSKGLGRNSIPDYADSLLNFLDSLEIDRAVIVGHSMGGGITLQFSLDHPDRVAGMGLLSTGSRMPVSRKLRDNLSIPAAISQVHKQIVDWSYGPLAGEDLKKLALRNLAETRPAVLAGDLAACDSFDVMERLAEIKIPTLVVCGSEDRMTPLHFSTKLTEEISGSALQVIESAGHMVMVEQSARVAGILSVFLRSLK